MTTARMYKRLPLNHQTLVLQPNPSSSEMVLAPEEGCGSPHGSSWQCEPIKRRSSNFNGIDAYLITFTNKDVVYVGLDGQVLAVQVAPVVVNLAPPPKQKKNNGGGNQPEGNGSEEHHESSEDHHEEEHED
jgi:hypothetical protein